MHTSTVSLWIFMQAVKRNTSSLSWCARGSSIIQTYTPTRARTPKDTYQYNKYVPCAYGFCARPRSLLFIFYFFVYLVDFFIFPFSMPGKCQTIVIFCWGYKMFTSLFCLEDFYIMYTCTCLRACVPRVSQCMRAVSGDVINKCTNLILRFFERTCNNSVAICFVDTKDSSRICHCVPFPVLFFHTFFGGVIRSSKDFCRINHEGRFS